MHKFTEMYVNFTAEFTDKFRVPISGDGRSSAGPRASQ